MSEIISTLPENTTLYHLIIGLSDKDLCIWSNAVLTLFAVISSIYGLYSMYVICEKKKIQQTTFYQGMVV